MALVVAMVAGGCSDDSTASSVSAAGVTTAPPPVVPITTTTTIAGTPVSDAEIYAQVGLDAKQAKCVEDSGIDGQFEATPGPGLLDALVLTGDHGAMVAVPAALRTGTELEQLMLDTLAKDCAPPDLLAKLAAIDGAALDEEAITDDLPVRLVERKADGATGAEVSCLDAKFREAPARLSSLAAIPALVEVQCASAERRAAWRSAALDRGLATATASPAERSCLVANAADQVLLSEAVDAVGSGDTSSSPIADATPTCVSADRLWQLALDVVAKGADFGAEALRPDPTTPPAG